MTVSNNCPVPDSISFGKTVKDVIKEVIGNENNDSFYILDLDNVIDRILYWQERLPRVKPFYAIKCNDCPQVLSTMSAFGTGLSCVNKAQIDMAIKCGANPSDIISSSPIPTKKFTKYAGSIGTGLLTFDSKIELDNARAVYPSAKMLLKIRVDERGTIDKLSIKFGADLEEVFPLLQYAKDIGIDVVGLSFSVRRGCWDRRVYKEAFEISSKIFGFANSLGFYFSVLDIGGGFPCLDGTSDLFDEVCEIVNENLERYFPPHSAISIMAQPGRYFVSSAFTLCTKITKKTLHNTENDDKIIYHIKEGIHGSFGGSLFYNQTSLPKSFEDSNENASFYTSIIKGSSTDCWDEVVDSCPLPNLSIGNYLIFENMGAYAFTSKPNFVNPYKAGLHLIASHSNSEYFKIP